MAVKRVTSLIKNREFDFVQLQTIVQKTTSKIKKRNNFKNQNWTQIPDLLI